MYKQTQRTTTLAFILLGLSQQSEPMNPSLHCRNTLSPSTSGLLLVNLRSVLCKFFYTWYHYCPHGMHPKPLPHTWISLPRVRPKCPTALNFSTWKFHKHIQFRTFKTGSSRSSPLHNCVVLIQSGNLSLIPDSAPPWPYHHLFKEQPLSQHYSKGFTSFHPYNHLLPQLKSPPSVTLSKARASIAGLSHPGGRWHLGPHTSLGHKVTPGASPNDTPALPRVFSLERLQTASLFHPNDQMWM